MRSLRPILLCSSFLLLYLAAWGQEELSKKFEKMKVGEEAAYEVIVSSNTGTQRSELLLEVYRVGFNYTKIRRVIHWKGKKRIQKLKLKFSQGLLQFLEEEIRKKWENPTVKKKVSSSLESVSLDKEVEVLLESQRGGRSSISTTRRSEFSCYRIDFHVKGRYPRPLSKRVVSIYQAHSSPAEMKISYWISPEVPIFGLVKAEGTIQKKIGENLVIQGKIQILLRRYKKAE